MSTSVPEYPELWKEGKLRKMFEVCSSFCLVSLSSLCAVQSWLDTPVVWRVAQPLCADGVWHLSSQRGALPLAQTATLLSNENPG